MSQQPEVIEQKAVSLPSQARTIRISDQKSFDHAARVLRDVRAIRKEIEDYHGPLKKAAYDAHRALCDAEAGMLKPVTEAEGILKRAIGAYEVGQKRIQDELVRKAREEAQKKADEERLARIREAERLARESAERMIIESKPANAELSFEELVALDMAVDDAAQAAADAVRGEPEAPLSYEAPNVIYKAPGVSTVTSYKAQVEDFKLLLQAVVDGHASQTLVMPDQSALNKLANALKKGFNVPGVRLLEVNNVRASASRRS